MSNNGGGSGDQQPDFLSDKRHISRAGLREKLEQLYFAETDGRPDLLLNAAPDERRELLREILDYMLATETISLTRQERTQLLEETYCDLFDFGPLRSCFDDDTLSEIVVNNAAEIYTRTGFQELRRTDIVFDDNAHLDRVLQSILLPAGYDLHRDSLVETGLIVAGRRVRLTSISPPLMPSSQITLRLHPVQPHTLSRLIELGFVEARLATMLREQIASGQGLMIAGDAGSGKTTLLAALLPELTAAAVVVERAAELPLPAAYSRLTTTPERSFAQQITAAMELAPAWLVLDELRFDESAAMWAAVTADKKSSLLWVARGSSDPRRLKIALSMAVRRAQAGIDQEYIHSGLMDRLPMVALLGRRAGKTEPQVLHVGVWESQGHDLTELELRLL